MSQKHLQIELEEIKRVQTMNKYAVKMRCTVCNHEQIVEPAAVSLRENNEISLYFGSSYDFCAMCDSPVEEISPQLSLLDPTYCSIHQHYKWCEHNGGVLGKAGYQHP